MDRDATTSRDKPDDAITGDGMTAGGQAREKVPDAHDLDAFATRQTDRLEREHLRLHFGLQVEHDADHARAVTRHAQLLDVRIVRGELAFELGERRREVVRLEVEDKARRILDREKLVFDLRRRLEGEARVIVRGPDPAGDDLRLRGTC